MAATTDLTPFTLPGVDNPLRPPDWRWRAAGDYRATPGDEYVRLSADAWVLRACVLQQDVEEAKSPHRLAWLLAQHGPLGQAYQVYRGTAAPGGRRHSPAAVLRATLEGLVLTGADDATVGAAAGLAADAVAAYAEVFFDARPRLGDAAWVAAAILGDLHAGDPESVFLAMIRAYGYQTGHAGVVTALAGLWRTLERGRGPAGLYDALLEDNKLSLAVKSSVASRAVHPEPRAFRSVLEMQLRHLEHTRHVDPARDGERGVAEAMTVLLQTRAEWGYNEAPADALPPRLTRPVEPDPPPAPSEEPPCPPPASPA